MSVQVYYECTNCSTSVPAWSYRAACPSCRGDLDTSVTEPDPSRKIPEYLRYGT